MGYLCGERGHLLGEMGDLAGLMLADGCFRAPDLDYNTGTASTSIPASSECSVILLAQFSDLFSTHWGWVLAIALVFFAVQLTLCGRFLGRMRRQRRTLASLHAHLAEGGDGRESIGALAAHFAWLRWVNDVFPAGTETPGNYTRDDVLQELDTRIASSPDYLLLQRMGVMAPLLGVILTVLGFFFLQVPEDAEQSLGDILFAVTPLVMCVGAGAVLAFINQMLLHVAGNQAEVLRMTARTWFDAAIWSGIGLDAQAATVKAIHAIERMADSVAQSVDQHTQCTQNLIETTSSIQQAGAALHEGVRAFGDELTGLPESLAGLHETTAATAAALEALIPVGQRAVAGLDVSVSAFRTAVENDFSQAAALHRGVIDGIHQSVDRVSQAAAQLQVGSDNLRETVDAQGQSYQALNESLQARVMPAHQSLLEAAAGLKDQMHGFRQLVETMSEQVTAVAGEFENVAGQLQPAVGAFRAAVDDQFTTAARRHDQNLEFLAESVAKIHEGSHALAEGSQVLQKMVAEQAALTQRVAPAHDALQEAVTQLSAVSRTLQETLDADVTPTQRSLHQASDRFADSAERLSSFAQHLEPAARQLAELDQTLAGLEGTVEALRDFSHVGGDVQQLTRALAQAATVADAISELPERVREILQESVAAAPRDGGPRKPLMPWLRGRP